MLRNKDIEAALLAFRNARANAASMMLSYIPLGTIGSCVHMYGQVNRSRCRVVDVDPSYRGLLRVELLDAKGGRSGRGKYKTIPYWDFSPYSRGIHEALEEARKKGAEHGE